MTWWKGDSMIRCKTQTNLRTWSKPATRLDKDTNSTLQTLKLTNAEAMARKVLGRGKTLWLWTVGWKKNTWTRGIRCEPDGKPLLWLPHDKTWIPDLPKGSDNYRFGWIRDTPIRLQIQRNEPCNLSTTNPLVINLAAARLTSPRRLTLACKLKNTSKCTEKQPN
jgi:hypothetical protein